MPELRVSHKCVFDWVILLTSMQGFQGDEIEVDVEDIPDDVLQELFSSFQEASALEEDIDEETIGEDSGEQEERK